MSNTTNKRPVLWTKDFILAFLSNLLLFYSFYMLIPVLPFYLIENLGTSNSAAGVVLSLYTISALLIRPFSGFMVDMFSRKPLYLLCYGVFSVLFAGYVVGTTLTLFCILRILHGFAFGISTVSGNTLAVDVMVPERRGEGIGYFGMAANIAMAIGPVAGLWIQKNYSFDVLFWAAFASSFIGLLTIVFIKAPRKEPLPAGSKQPVSLDRFILLKGLPCVVLLFVVGLGYGAMLNYAGLYAEAASFNSSAGVFFVFLSLGIVLARILSARSINKGKITAMVYIGTAVTIASFTLFAFCSSALMFYATAFLTGIGFGYICPAFQTMFINLAEHNQRGTANATYFTFWDFGIGAGTVIGGFIIEEYNFQWLYGVCAGVIVLGLVYFTLFSASYFEKNKLR